MRGRGGGGQTGQRNQARHKGKEARRECVASARNNGYSVLNLSEAKWLGAAKHEVMLTVEKAGSPQQTLRCVYDQRDHVTDLQTPEVR